MSDTILGGRWTVYYGAENRQKRVSFSGSVTETDPVNALYSALQDLFDELNQMDDGVVISAQTPTEYTIGIIDAGDKDPWFIDKDSVEHLTGGAIKTASWNRVTTSNVGIVKVICNNTDIVAGDIGQTATHASGASGTLLDVKGTGANSELWIRPANFNAANDWDNTDSTITCNAHTAVQSASGESGEMLWANIYSLGALESFTHLYIFQSGEKLNAYKGTDDWWTDDHIDVLIDVKELGEEIDEGWITVFARQYSKSWGYYQVDLTAGGRNPIPLATGIDLNNTSGIRRFTGAAGSGTFTADRYMFAPASATWATAEKNAVITAVAGTTGAPILDYYLIGDLTDFATGNSVLEYTGTENGGASCTAGAAVDVGPASFAGLSITHANDNTHDIDENGTNEYYSIVANINNRSVADGYEWTKYETRRGESGTTNHDGLEGQEYLGTDYRVVYTTLVGTVNEGVVVKQWGTGASGTVVAHHTTPKILVLRNSRSSFNNSGSIGVDAANGVTGPTCATITPITAAPYGTFAGGIWFCAPGVVLDNYQAGEANQFQLVDDLGAVVLVPTKVTVAVTNTASGDKIAVFRLLSQGGDLEKNYYTLDTDQASNTTTFSVDPVIRVDEPGKTTGGILFHVDTSGQEEYRYRFTSWTGDDFTLYNKGASTGAAGTDASQLVAHGVPQLSSGILVGDIVHNQTRQEVTYVTAIASSTTLLCRPTISGQTTGDVFRVGAVAVSGESGSDTIYVPFIHTYETVTGDEEASIVYSTPVYCRIRARQAGDILPFESDSSIGAGGMSVSIIRTDDTIYS